MRRHRLARHPASPLKTARLKAAVGKLGRTPHPDAETEQVISEAQKLIDAGWTERRGPDSAASKPRPLPKELEPYRAQWAKKPPEWGEQ